MLKTQQTITTPTQTQQKNKWATFTYYSPLIHKVTNLFKYINLNRAFWVTNTSYNILCNKIPQNKENLQLPSTCQGCFGIKNARCIKHPM